MSRKPADEVLEAKIFELETCLNALSENVEKNRQGEGELQAITDLLPAIGRIAKDIADRRRDEEDVRSVKEMLQLVMDNIPQFIFWKSRDMVYLGCNQNFARVAGVEGPEAIVGKTDYDLAWKREEADFFRQCDRRVMETDTPEYHILEPQFQADGKQAWLDTNKIPLHDADGQVVGILGTYEDITDRKRTQETMRLYEKIVATTRDMMSIIDTDYIYRTVNDAYLEAHAKARADIVGRSAADLMGAAVFAKNVKPRLDRALAGDAVQYDDWFEYPGRGRRYMHVSYYPFRDDHGKVTGVVVNVHDITRVRQLETQLRQAQRLEAIGTLAGGVAHDFNNLLMGIQGRASLMAAEMDASHSFWEHVRGIAEYVQSATSLTSQLLGFARRGKYEVRPTAINAVVDKVAAMFGRTRKEIRIVKRYGSRPDVAEVDQRQLEQVLLNLFVNAWQAMPGGGDLILDTEMVLLGETQAASHSVTAGRYVKIAVSDTGVGMDESLRQRIFDPFFTTKEMGRGTGLGLASAYGIIKNHGGFITAESKPGIGSTFSIYLPAADKHPEYEETTMDKIISGTETLLLVDDERVVLDVGRAMLVKLGYQVMTAASGTEAVEIYRSHRDTIEMVILDMIMPGMSGSQTFEALKAINSDIRVLLSSGYSIDGEAATILENGCRGFIQKPFGLEHLARKIRKVLK